MVFLIWIRYTIFPYVQHFLNKVPYIGFMSKSFFPACIVLLTFFSLPWMVKRIRIRDIMFYLSVVVVVLCTLLFYEKNAPYVEQYWAKILLETVPMLFVGLCYEHERCKKALFWVSLAGTAAVLAYQVYQLLMGRTLMADNMDTAYKILPSILYMVYYAMREKKIRYWICAAVGVCSVFVFGTRGPILCILIFFALFFLLKVWHMKNGVKKLGLIALILLPVILLLSGDALMTVSMRLSELFSEMGFSSRIFDMFTEGMIADNSGRDSHFLRTVAAIAEKPVFGYGLMGDWVVNKLYVHNYFLELWCQFGVLFGTVIALGFILIPLNALHKSRDDEDMLLFILMLMCATFVKLMVSGSYLFEPFLFLLLGISTACVRKK